MRWLASCCLLFAACGGPEPETLLPAHEEVRKYFQSGKEPLAKDAIWTSPTIFKVAVFENGSNRNGYANYVCEVLAEQGFKGKRVWVQILDMGAVLRKEKWKKLGEAHCP
ncbi:MAG: hypothetical protein EOP52_13865 [Sphingobacteriales bacterium]|nr:MAG: hypothetical protein EOP52_13865 [Sphingobacteriales bacterium]